jgi:hypothetical protein
VVEYSGLYEADGYGLDLHVERGGAVTGGGYDTIDFDSSRRLDFTLKDARIDGALLTAVKIYENGETRRFEGVFANRTVTTGKNPNEITGRETSFGLGFVENHTPAIAGSSEKLAPSPGNTWTNRVFLERH